MKKASKVFWLVLFGILVVGFTNLKYSFADSTKEQIAKEIQKIRDKGGPTTIEELVPEEIPDEKNGALVFREAFDLKEKLEKEYKEEWKYIPYEGFEKWEEISEEEKEKVTALLFKNSEFLRFYQLLEKASNMKCQFLKRKDYEKGAGMLLPHLAKMRGCVRMLVAKAKLQAEKGEIDDALNTCLIGLKLSGSLTGEPTLISSLVKIALNYLVLNQIEAVLNKGEANVNVYQSLINEIEKERQNELVRLSLLGEKIAFGIIQYPLTREYAEKGIKERQQKMGRKLSNEEIIEEFCKVKTIVGMSEKIKEKEYEEFKQKMMRTYANSSNILEDFYDNQKLSYLETMAKVISLAKNPYWELKEQIPVLNKEIQNLPNEKAVLVQMLVPALFRVYEIGARLDAQLGNSEIALACHIYKAKYGNYPESISQLYPKILPSLPLDPFTGRNHIYRREGDGFIVYSLGDNAKDDGGISGSEKRWQGDFDIVWRQANTKQLSGKNITYLKDKNKIASPSARNDKRNIF